MKIACVSSTGRRSLLMLTCDGDPWKEVHVSIFGRQPVFPEFSSQEELEAVFSALEFRQAKQYALRRLSAQNMPTAGLERALRQRLVSAETIQRLIEELISSGYLNDRLWAESYVRGQKGKRRGPRAIAQKLAVKGIDRDQIESVLESARDEEGEQEALKHLISTRYKRHDLSDYHARQKVVAALVRRGFELPSILKAIKR